MQRRHEGTPISQPFAAAIAEGAAVHAQDLGPYPLPAPSCTVLSSVDGGHAGGGSAAAAGGGSAPADPAAQEEIFVDALGTAVSWRSLGGQVAHTSFRSVVLGPTAALEGGLRGGGIPAAPAGGGVHGAITQAVRCRFPTLLEGWSSTLKGGIQMEERSRRRQRNRRGPWSVCILRNPDLVTVHYPRGDSHDVTLPCEARLLQPLGEGLLVQRYAGGGNGDGAEFSSTAAYGGEDEQEDDGLDPLFSVPSLFSLLHPLDELRPVALLPPAAGGRQQRENGRASLSAAGAAGSPLSTGAAEEQQQQQQQRLVCDASERVVFARGGGDGATGRDTSLLLTYHAGRRRHSLWHVTPVPEPETGPESTGESEAHLATAGGISGSGSMMMDQSPGGPHSLAATTPGLSSTRGADTSSLSSTLLGVSALKSPSSAAGLSMMDSMMDSMNPRRDRHSVGGGGTTTGRSRLSAGGAAGRRASSGSNASWIGAGNTRNEALASALGLGQSALGVASNILSLSGPPVGQHTGVPDRGAGAADPFQLAAGLNASSSMTLGESLVQIEMEEEEDEAEEDSREGPQPIRPHLGISLVWREGEDSLAPAQHVFCAEGGPSVETAKGGGCCSPGAGSFLLCFVETQASKLRALSVSFSGAEDSAGGGVEVAEAFTLPCRSAVGLCATGGGEGEGTPGAAISADILILRLDGRLALYRGESPVTRVALPTLPGGEAIGDREEEEPELVSEAVGSCFTVTTRDGRRRRLRLSLDPASPLVSACLGAWDSMLSAPLAASLRADVASAAHALAGHEERPRPGDVAGEEGGPGGGGGVKQSAERAVENDLDWAALVSVMRGIVLGTGESVSSITPLPEPAAETDDDDDDDDDGEAWASLLASPFHDEFSRANAMMLSGLHYMPPASDGLSPQRGAAPDATSPSRRQRVLLQTRRSAFLAEAAAAFDAMHLVLEDLKTSCFTVSLVPRLASLLLSLTRLCGGGGGGAEMRDFTDHYWRDAAGCGRGGGETASMIDGGVRAGREEALLPNRPTRFDRVPCIRNWVHARIRTAKVSATTTATTASRPGLETTTTTTTTTTTPRYTGEDGPFPTLPKSHGVLQNTRCISRFYTVICGSDTPEEQQQQQQQPPPPQRQQTAAGATDSDNPSGASTLGPGCRGSDRVGARLVAAMVDEGYGVDDLERAPLGLALPLVEVLHAASGQAPVEWPVAAQELVGRQDLSALRRMLGAFGDVDGFSGGGDPDGDHPEEVSWGTTGGYWAGGRVSGSGAGARDAAGGGGVTGQGSGGALDQTRGGGSGGGGGGGGAAAAASAVGAGGEAADLDGLAWVDEVSSLRFGRDRRVREACRLLRGSRPVRYHVERSPESSDHDHQQRQQARLLQLAMRTLAGPVGRGMLTLGTLAPLLAEPLPIPPLCLAGRIRKPADVVVNLDLAAAAVPPETTAWAEFHNGVAAGLRLQHEWGSGRVGGKDNDRTSGIGGGGGFEEGGVSRTWITYNKPAGGANNAHGGLLMALGLQGHLSSLAMTDVFQYLTLGQESTTVGVLLGMAAARRGSADLPTHKMLCLHVPSLLPHPFADMDTSSVTQAAALAGVGLLYQGTSHRLMTEFLLGEMGRAPSSDRFADREGYALACGLSLGMINLGKGASGGMAGVADLKLEQQLHRYMSGGKDPASASASADPGGPNNRGGGGGGGVSSRGAGSRGGAAGGSASGPGSGSGGGSESSGPSRISAGEYVNTDVTAPAALVALALIHVRSGDRALAARLALPQSHFQLDYARPEQLLLRVVVRGLVMWDEVEPTDGWIEAQIPEVVAVEYGRLNEPLPEELTSVVDRQTIRQAHANIIAGGCLCLGLRFAGTADERARTTVLGRVRHFKALRESVGGSSGGIGRDPPVAYVAARRPERPVLEMCLSTSVTALGMIMAGTGDVECLRVMRELRGRVEGEVTYGTHMAIAMSIGLLFLGGGMASLGRENEHVAALLGAFFPRYPAAADDNQYHLQALRHLYVLAVQRRGVDAVDVDTGESLFVPIKVVLSHDSDNNSSGGFSSTSTSSGGAADGRANTRREAEDSAVMNGGSPGRGGEAGSAGEVRSGSGRTLSLVTPCVLPDLKEVSSLSVCSPRYFPVELDVAGNPALASALRRRCKIYVKRRVGHLSYKNDPHALRSLLFQSYPGAGLGPGPSSSSSLHHNRHHHHGHHHHHDHSTAFSGGGGSGEDPVQSKSGFLSTFTEDPHLLNFARHFCDSGISSSSGGDGGSGISAGRRLMLGADALGDAPALARYFGGALLECLAGEKVEALGPHLSLCHSTVTAGHTMDASAAWDLRLVLDYGRGSALQAALMRAAAMRKRAGGGPRRRKTGRGGGEAEVEVEAPPPFTLLHPDLLASLEVRLDVFFSSLGFYGSGGGGGAAPRDSREKQSSRLWRYLYAGGGGGGGGGGRNGREAGAACREDRLFGAYLAYFGIPAPAALERALGGREVPPEGLGLTDAPALLRGLPGLTPSALLKIT